MSFTMKIVLGYVLLVCAFGAALNVKKRSDYMLSEPEIVEAPHFRCDYKYEEDAEGWIKHHEIPGTWSEARLQCYLEGAVLASPIVNYGIKDVMTTATSYPNPDKPLWTGIHATYSDRQFSSIEGIPLNMRSHDWSYPDMPHNIDGEECLSFVNGKLYADPCSRKRPFMCYKKKSNELVVNECGTIDKAYTLEPKTGSCYKIHTLGRPWKLAYQTCEAEGAYLAIINSEAEAGVVTALMPETPATTPQVRIGAYYVMNYSNNASQIHSFIGFTVLPEYDWLKMTIHGQELSEAGYDRFKRDGWSSSSSNSCGSITKEGYLDNISCDQYISFICEKDPATLLSASEYDSTCKKS